ncbi:MAG: alpha/beta fold hydrolase [Chloroflexi bacterium]|nr:alpha/beta fold hydrolase [Chloroflexota bacterium]
MDDQGLNVLKKRVTFRSGKLTLEGILHTFDVAEPRPGVVVCHPHPLFGGSMHNLVVANVCEELARKGIVALRFNFRGVEGSQGSHGEGVDEIADVEAAVDCVVSLPNSDATRVGVTGYSFGCFVGLKAAAQDERVGAVVGISPPLSKYDFSFLRGYARPKLLLAGERDELIPSTEEFTRFVEGLPEPKRFEILSSADHYWLGFERRVATRLADFFADVFKVWQLRTG